ncbi:MAG: hypothetical protein AAF790_05910 [Planctomycetota bacterium]
MIATANESDTAEPNGAQNEAEHAAHGAAADGRPELVVLTHGIASTRWVMLPLAWRMRRRGYRVRLLGYYSLTGSNRRLGRWLAKNVRRLDATGKYSRIHLVVHSMGSIVTRCALEEEMPASLGRVVMLGPPNGGSHMATFLQRVYWFSGPLMELRDQPDSFVNRLPPAPAGVDIGVLAAKHDNVIALERTHLPGQADHRVVNTWHTGVLWRRETADLAANFLQHGRFDPAG